MATIKERAEEHYPIGIGVFTREGAELLQKAYIKGATEQDRIARAEERDRCIQMAQLRECKRCKDNDKCWLCDDCTIMQDVREAMEGDEV